MNRNNLQSLTHRARDTVRDISDKARSAFGTAGAALAVGMTVTPGMALAASDPGAAIQAEVSSAKDTVAAILVVLAGVVGLFILWTYLKKAR